MRGYLTDGQRLLEIIGEAIVRNHGLGPSLVRYIAVVDCMTGERRLLVGERIAQYDLVRGNV
jgi:hypothetical protein